VKYKAKNSNTFYVRYKEELTKLTYDVSVTTLMHVVYKKKPVRMCDAY
jgi:hypothetical protein